MKSLSLIISCSSDYYKSKLESISRIPIPEFLVLTIRCSQENEWNGFHPPGWSCSTLTLSLSSLYLYTQPCQLAFRRRAVQYKYTSVGTHFGLEINDISFPTFSSTKRIYQVLAWVPILVWIFTALPSVPFPLNLNRIFIL